jgi:N6-adenosine-specific RNA methylase IME4
MTAHQLPLVTPIRPPDLISKGINFQNCHWRDLPNDKLADVAIIDPPWKYSQRNGKPPPYPGIPTAEVKSQIEEMALTRMAKDSRILLWLTWPILPELWGWTPPGYRLVTGGAWVKSGPNDTGHYGQGYHWAGCSEPVLVFVRGKTHTDRSVKLRNAWVQSPEEHSRKPVDWMTQWLERWTTPGMRVFVPYAGLCPEVTACIRTNCFLDAAEISPERYADALALLAQGG